jgi:hypothetical protein
MDFFQMNSSVGHNVTYLLSISKTEGFLMKFDPHRLHKIRVVLIGFEVLVSVLAKTLILYVQVTVHRHKLHINNQLDT